MAVPNGTGYKIEHNDLKQRLKKATKVGRAPLSREWYEQDVERQRALVNTHKKNQMKKQDKGN